MRLSIEEIKNGVLKVINNYPVSRISLFGSQAKGTADDTSDLDFIVEFSEDVTLLTLCRLQCDLEEVFQKKVDIVHGPIRKSDLIEVDAEIELYAA